LFEFKYSLSDPGLVVCNACVFYGDKKSKVYMDNY